MTTARSTERGSPGWNSWQALIDQSTYDYYNYAMNLNGKVKYWGDPRTPSSS